MFTPSLGHFVPRDRGAVSAIIKAGLFENSAGGEGRGVGLGVSTISAVIPGRAKIARARNPYSRWWLWIPGSLVSLAPRNDGERAAQAQHAAVQPSIRHMQP